MMLDMREISTNKLVSKDILDIDMDLSIKGEGGKYRVEVNQKYMSPDAFATEAEAEDYLRSISLTRNQVESDLRAYA